MAKLSARNRTELARVVKEHTRPDLVPCDVCNGTKVHTSDFLDAKVGDPCTVCKGVGMKAPLTCWERRTLTLMSDGKILVKDDVRFQPDMYDKDGRLHSYGWKVYGKAKAALDRARFVEMYAKHGYVEKTK